MGLLSWLYHGPKISVGDNVVALRGCPNCSFGLGAVYTVQKISKAELGFRCGNCNTNYVYGPDTSIEGPKYNLPRAWVKKIDPDIVKGEIVEIDKLPVKAKKREPAHT